MSEEVKTGESKGKISRNIKNLYLDPNNYRFVDDLNYEKVSDEKLQDEKVQRRTRGLIEGAKREKIKDLIDSFKANGYLKVDVIQLRDLGDNHFPVIEGNRRVAALKCLQEDYKNGLSIGKLDPQIFSSVPSEINEDKDGLDHLIVMGLKHISGNKKWAAINQAQLIYDYLLKYWEDKEVYWEKETELCNSLGISKTKLRNSQRAYRFINAYKKSDYGDQFTSDKFSIFEETTKRPILREWLGWDDNSYTATNRTNEERFFSWISQVDEGNDDELSGEDSEEFGEDSGFAVERETREPIITKAFEIRDLATFIKNEDMLFSMEECGSVSKVMYEKGIDGRTTIDKAMSAVRENVRTIKRFADILEEEDVSSLKEVERNLGELIPREKISELSNSGVKEIFSAGKITHFAEVRIQQFKKIAGMDIENLRRVNLFAGPNNSGKTTILEAIYLLCHQNDIGALLEMAKSRNRATGVTPQYLYSLLEQNIAIGGEFNACAVSAAIARYQDPNVEKYDDYITSVQADGEVEDQSACMKLHLYGSNQPNREYASIQHICRTIYSSPYHYQPEQLYQLYAKAVEAKINGEMVFGKVLEFIRRIDPKIRNIFLVEENGEKSFRVDSEAFQEKTMELSSYGEGLVRIFELALSVSNCRNGVLLIDEFEAAIHYSLLVEFTRFIHELADEFYLFYDADDMGVTGRLE
ncbi:MAG: hypothetical protein NC121_07410, partial [Blautia sp.]|nr:hypothetical protein [Blautia sp.]